MINRRNWRKTAYRRLAVILVIFSLCGCMGCFDRLTPFAGSIEELEQQREQAENDAAELEQQKEQAEKDAAELEEAKKKLQDSLGDMNSELFQVSNDVSELQDEIAETEKAIAEAKDALAIAQQDAEKQYESMKLRIQYMYENGDAFSWTCIFSAESFADALNRMEYAIDLATTDRLLLEEYKLTLQQIETDKTALEEKRKELLLAQAQLDEKKGILLASIETTQADISDTDGQLADKQDEIEDFAEQIAAMEEYERKLEEEKAKKQAEEQARIKAEEEARKKAEEEAKKKAEEEAKKKAEEEAAQNAQGDAGQNQGEEEEPSQETQPDENNEEDTPRQDYWLHTTTPVEVTAEEEELFAALIYCEAGGESYETQFAVASVVINRINSPRFPDNLIDVMYQKGQFSPVASGRLAVVLEKGLTTDSCRKAAREALAGNICGDWLFFCYNFGTIDGTVIGSEVFY